MADRAELDAYLSPDEPEPPRVDCLAAGATETCGECDGCLDRAFEEASQHEEPLAFGIMREP